MQRNRFRAAARNHLFRTASRMPYFLTWLRNHRWLPDARYRDGLLARNGNGAVGWLIPQPSVLDEKGDTVRLDDVIGGRWSLLHKGSASDWPDWRAAGAPVRQAHAAGQRPARRLPRRCRRVADPLAGKKGAAVVAVRPDGSSTPAPPRGSRCRHRRPASRHQRSTR